MVKAMAPGYDAVEKLVKIVKDGVTVLDFVLQETAKTGKVLGAVLDAKTKAGIYAVVSFPNGEHSNIPTDPDTGRFVIELPAGTYQIKVADPNYKAVLQPVVVEKGKETKVVFELKPYEKVRVTAERVEIKETIQFTPGKATIKIESYPILDEIAQVLKEVPEMRLVIEGHTDSIGDATVNKQLSQKRADAVRDYLISRGTNADRVTAVGYGEERPIADNGSESGREKNRRVEFKIVK
jgi:outer membrane protein OmpA-like peptidoglycan-associated protein